MGRTREPGFERGVIAWGAGGYDAQVARVVVADVLVVVLLLLDAGIEWRKSVVA